MAFSKKTLQHINVMKKRLNQTFTTIDYAKAFNFENNLKVHTKLEEFTKKGILVKQSGKPCKFTFNNIKKNEFTDEEQIKLISKHPSNVGQINNVSLEAIKILINKNINYLKYLNKNTKLSDEVVDYIFKIFNERCQGDIFSTDLHHIPNLSQEQIIKAIKLSSFNKVSKIEFIKHHIFKTRLILKENTSDSFKQIIYDTIFNAYKDKGEIVLKYWITYKDFNYRDIFNMIFDQKYLTKIELYRRLNKI